MATHQPWLFPSLGPALMLHVKKPQSPEPSPRQIAHAAVVLVTVVDWAYNRATGRAMPVWAAPGGGDHG